MNDSFLRPSEPPASFTRSDHPAESRHPTTAKAGSAQPGSTVLVADAKPLSLLATAGVLHHAGMRCLCARTPDAVMRACEIPLPSRSDSVAAEVEVPRVESRRVDEPRTGLPSADSIADLVRPGGIDLIVWDVGDEVAVVLQTLTEIRQWMPDLPAVLIASSRWAGLQKKTELLRAPTRCLFQPIDPASLVAVCEPLLWMPALQSMHRRRGSRPNRPGWVTL